VTFRTRKAGVLEVAKASEGYELALPVTLVERDSNPDLIAAIRFRGEVFVSWYGAEQTAIIAMQSEAEIRGLEPDLNALRQIDLMAICTAPANEGSDYDVVSRVFVPAWGVDEDSVTGSAHAALAPFWAERLGKREMRAHQASARGGDLTMRLEGEGKDQRAWLGGPCVTVVEGTFRL
jgi:predicted PhzF superfamily epimerase YddE/YHI9